VEELDDELDDALDTPEAGTITDDTIVVVWPFFVTVLVNIEDDPGGVLLLLTGVDDEEGLEVGGVDVAGVDVGGVDVGGVDVGGVDVGGVDVGGVDVGGVDVGGVDVGGGSVEVGGGVDEELVPGSVEVGGGTVVELLEEDMVNCLNTSLPERLEAKRS
jgi:hypothetical protein